MAAVSETETPCARRSRGALHQSEEVRTRWAAHDVRFDDIGVKHFRHPAIGDLSPSFDRLDVAADPGPTIFASAAEPGSRSEEALKLLGS